MSISSSPAFPFLFGDLDLDFLLLSLDPRALITLFFISEGLIALLLGLDSILEGF